MKPQMFKKEEFVYRDCTISMGKDKMASLMYAVIITGANIPNTWGLGIYDYTRSQNNRNNVEIKIHIHPDFIEKFEQESGTKLHKPISVQIN